MKINLREYATEFRYWIEAFDAFVAPASRPALSRLRDQLEDGRENLRPAFPWKLAVPVRTIVADRYDGPYKEPHEVVISWQFESVFETGPDSRKKSIWFVKEMVTHIRIHSLPSDNVVLHFHYDLRNKNQLGPHMHMQLSEEYLKEKKRIPIAVPRFPSMTMLPTDCLDLVLSEFFPFRWPQSQSGLTGLNALQSRQHDRMLKMSQALMKDWSHSRMTPVAAIQRCYFPDFQIA